MNRRLFLAGGLLAALPRPAAARLVTIREEFGNKPETHARTPGGLPLVNLPGRVFLRHFDGWGMSDQQYYYAGGPTAVADAVRLYAAVRHPVRWVRLSAREGVTYTHDEKRRQVRYEVCFRDVDHYQPRLRIEPKETALKSYSELTIHLTASAVPPADPDRVRALVSDLGSPRYAARAAADRELAKLGRAAKPGLVKGRAAGSPEAQTRIDALLARLTGLALDDFELPAGVPVVADFPPAEADRKPLHAEIERFVAGRGRE